MSIMVIILVERIERRLKSQGEAHSMTAHAHRTKGVVHTLLTTFNPTSLKEHLLMF